MLIFLAAIQILYVLRMHFKHKFDTRAGINWAVFNTPWCWKPKYEYYGWPMKSRPIPVWYWRFGWLFFTVSLDNE